jgi:hypothetical protein
LPVVSDSQLVWIVARQAASPTSIVVFKAAE